MHATPEWMGLLPVGVRIVRRKGSGLCSPVLEDHPRLLDAGPYLVVQGLAIGDLRPRAGVGEELVGGRHRGVEVVDELGACLRQGRRSNLGLAELVGTGLDRAEPRRQIGAQAVGPRLGTRGAALAATRRRDKSNRDDDPPHPALSCRVRSRMSRCW